MNPLQFTFNFFGGDLNGMPVYYDFTPSGSYVNNAANNFSGQYLGIISGNTDTFFASPGSGTFSQHLVTISGTQNLVLSDFSAFFWGTRQANGRDNVLFSSIENFNSGISSGAHIYINSANKLVFTFNTCIGQQSYASNFNVISDFAIGISKTQNRIDLYQHDYTTNTLKTNSFVITRPSDYFPCNNFSIGYAPRGANIINNQFYSGTLGNFILVSGGIDHSNALPVFSGYYNQITTITTPAVSGDACSTIFSVPTTKTFLGKQLPPAGMFNKNGILIFSLPFTAADSAILDCAKTGTYLFNQSTLFSPFKNVVTLNNATYNDIGLYFNGQRLISGQNIVTGTFCGTGIYFPRDYDIGGRQNILSPINFNINDVLIFDNKSSNTYIPQTVLSSGTGTFTVSTGFGLAYYVNGIRSENYTQSGTTIIPQSNLNNNDIISVDYFDSSKIANNIQFTQNPYFVTGGFIPGTSMLYFNGQRLTLGADYIEINSGEFSSFLFKAVPTTQIFESNSPDNSWNI